MIVGDESHQGLLVGGRFSELEDALCERIAELKRGRPLAPLTVVVGSGAVRTRISDLLVRRLGAVANVDVVTLSRMARDRVARALGAPVDRAGRVHDFPDAKNAVAFLHKQTGKKSSKTNESVS